MTNENLTGRLIGGLLLLAMLLGLWNNFALTEPIFSGAGYLQNGANMPALFGASVLLALFTSALSLTVAILVWPVLRRYTPALALAFLLMTGIGFVTSTVEQANFLAMQSLSQQYAKQPNLDPALFEVLRGMVSAYRNWSHFLDKFLGGATILLFNLALFRANLLPRLITGFGMLAALSQMSGIAHELFSRDLPMLMLAPLALAQLMLCLTLLARGFSQAGTQRPAAA